MDIVFIVKYSGERSSLVNAVMNLLGTGKGKSFVSVLYLKIIWLSGL